MNLPWEPTAAARMATNPGTLPQVLRDGGLDGGPHAGDDQDNQRRPVERQRGYG